MVSVRTLKDIRFKKFGRYTNVTKAVSAGRSIAVTSEAKKSLVQYTIKTNFILNL